MLAAFVPLALATAQEVPENLAEDQCVVCHVDA